MTSLPYLEVAVDAPLGRDRTLTYSSPPGQRLGPGWLVWVPLLSRPVQGVVLSRTENPPAPELAVREVLSGVGPGPLVTPWRLELARWLGHHYRCSLFEAVSLMLPPGYKDRVRSRLHPPGGGMTELARVEPAVASAISKAGLRGLSDRELTFPAVTDVAGIPDPLGSHPSPNRRKDSDAKLKTTSSAFDRMVQHGS